MTPAPKQSAPASSVADNRVRLSDLQDSLERMHQHWDENRNFEFFYIPFTGKTVEIRHDITDAPETRAPRDLDMIAVKVLKLARKGDKIQMSGQIEYGADVVFLTMRRIGEPA